MPGGAACAAPPFFSNTAFPAADIQAKAFGDEQNLADDEVTEAVQQNPELSADARQKLLKNIHSTTLAGNSARTHRAHSLKCNENATPQELVKYPRLFNGGRVAQLAEHLLCKQGVGGSSPPTSTNFNYLQANISY